MNPSIGGMWRGFCAKDFIEPNRLLYDHELVFFNSGVSRIVTEKQELRCVKGDVVIIPPGMTHWSHCLTARVERCCVHFDFEPGLDKPNPPYVFVGKGEFDENAAKPAPRWLPVKFPFFKSCDPAGDVSRLVKELFSAGDDTPTESLRRKALFLELLAELFKESDDAPRKEVSKPLRTALRIKGHIDRDFKTRISIDKLSERFRITPSHMCRLFRENIGMTPTKYIQKLRIREAERLIRETNMSMAEIAYAAGFNDPNYFARVFRRHQGAPPSKYAGKTRL